MERIKIEKRLPFGFKGEWAKLYKLYNAPEISSNITYIQEETELKEIETATLEYEKSFFADIGQDIQVKNVNEFDRFIELTTELKNLINRGEYRLSKTTDAYFNDSEKRYCCVVNIGDILKMGEIYYLCTDLKIKNMVTPNEQEFYYMTLKRVFPNVLKGGVNV